MELIDRQQEAAEQEWLSAWLAGPVRVRHDALPPQVGDPAPDMELADTSGRIRRFSEFWRDRPALILFLRHFGCSCLAERWDKLRDEVAAFAEAGAAVIAVGQGEPERSAAVASRRGYSFPLLSDPDRRAYAAYGLLEGTPAQILHDFAWTPNDRTTGESMITARRGGERALVDNPWQLPGEFVVAPGGRIVLAHRYQFCEDFPPKTVLLGAIQAAVRAG